MAEKTTTYTTVQGDMFDSIAFKVLGSCSYTDKLIALNPQYMITHIFSSGEKLVLPVITAETAKTSPPWRR